MDKQCPGQGSSWSFLAGVTLGAAASLGVVLLASCDARRRTVAELTVGTETLRRRLEQLAAQLGGQGKELISTQREALEAAVQAGQAAARRRAEEMHSRLHQT